MSRPTAIHPTTPQQHRFHLLDALRGIAAILVLPLHVYHEYLQIFRRGDSYLAVDFFFCLSGFVVAFSYERRLLQSMTFAKFLIARLLRLYPLAVCVSVLGALELWLLPLGNFTWAASPTPLRAAIGILILPQLDHHYLILYPLNPVLWTLLMELVVNAGYAAAVRLRAANNWLLAVAVLLLFHFIAGPARLYGNLNLGVTRGGAYPGFLRAALSFSLGIAVMRLYRATSHRRISGHSAAFTCIALVGIVVASLFGPTVGPFLLLLIIGLVFPALIYVAAHVTLPKSLIRPCAFLGDISYPLYVMHLPIVYPLFAIPILIRFSIAHPVDANLFLVAVIGLLIPLAWCLSHFYDAPVRKFLAVRYNKAIGVTHV